MLTAHSAHVKYYSDSAQVYWEYFQLRQIQKGFTQILFYTEVSENLIESIFERSQLSWGEEGVEAGEY